MIDSPEPSTGLAITWQSGCQIIFSKMAAWRAGWCQYVFSQQIDLFLSCHCSHHSTGDTGVQQWGASCQSAVDSDLEVHRCWLPTSHHHMVQGQGPDRAQQHPQRHTCCGWKVRVQTGWSLHGFAVFNAGKKWFYCHIIVKQNPPRDKIDPCMCAHINPCTYTHTCAYIHTVNRFGLTVRR